MRNHEYFYKFIKKIIEDYQWITNICGSCHALLENHIEYTNKLLRYAIIKMIERMVFMSEQEKAKIVMMKKHWVIILWQTMKKKKIMLICNRYIST